MIEDWCQKNGLVLLRTTVGFADEMGYAICGTEVTEDGIEIHPFIEYEWMDTQNIRDVQHPGERNRVDPNGVVWAPKRRHEQPIIFVYERYGPLSMPNKRAAMKQLEKWIRWFDTNGFVYEKTALNPDELASSLEAMADGVRFNHRMRRRTLV